MDCRDAQRALSTRSEASPGVGEHLERCDNCRQFAGDLQNLRTLTQATVTTPAALRARTLDQCRELLAEHETSRKISLLQRCRRMCDSPQFVVATAILGVLTLIALAVWQVDDTWDQNSIFYIKLTIIQFVIQNLVAALFLPALLKIKNKFGNGLPYAAELGD